MTNPPLTFSGITPAQFATLAAKAQASGLAFTGTTGTATKFGVQISWNYDSAAQQLTFQCLKAPFFVKVDDVYAKLQSVVQQALSSA